MQKRDYETYQKRFRDFEILPKFSETHVFRGTIRHPSICILLIMRKGTRAHKTKDECSAWNVLPRNRFCLVTQQSLAPRSLLERNVV